MRRIISIAAMALAMTFPCQAADIAIESDIPDWHEGDRLMLSVNTTAMCASAPIFREFYRIASAGRTADAIWFATLYCQKIGWAPVPLVVMYEDDFSGERNPGVCVRQINWRDCGWIAREHLKPFIQPRW